MSQSNVAEAELDDSQFESATPTVPEAFEADGPANEREQRKRERRLDARSWAPRESVPVVHHDIVVGTDTIRRTWNLLFVRAQTTLYMLQTIVPSQGALEEGRELDAILLERLQNLESELQNERERLVTVAKADGIDNFPEKSYTNAEKIRVPIYTPAAARYLRLILSIDDMFWMLDYLWLNGLIKNTHKWQVINRWKRLLWDFVRFTTTTWIRARASLRSKQSARRDRNTRKGAESTANPGAVEAEPSGEPAAEAVPA